MPKRVEFSAVIGMAVEFDDGEEITAATIAEKANTMMDECAEACYLWDHNIQDKWEVEEFSEEDRP